MITKKQISYFNRARNAALASNHPQYKLGAVVVFKHQVISVGSNNFHKSHPKQVELNKLRFDADCKNSIHAELAALLPVINKYDLSTATIYVYREHANGTLAMARPCKGCMSLIRGCGIKKVYYTTCDGYAEETIL